MLLESQIATDCVKSCPTWDARTLSASISSRWVSDIWEGRVVGLKINGKPTKWRINTRIGDEKDHKAENNLLPPFDSTAVFLCTRIDTHTDSVQQNHAVLKIYMQIPDRGSHQGQTPPISKVPQRVKAEVEALRSMNRFDGDAPGPKLLAYKYRKQQETHWVPGGYTCFVLMEKLPGRPLDYDYYWGLSFEGREAIRAAFREPWMKVIDDLKIFYRDTALRNLLWNEEKGKLYIVDYEGCGWLPPNGHSAFSLHHWELWGLTRSTCDDTEQC